MSGRSKRPGGSDVERRQERTGPATYVVKPIGFVRSSLKRPEDAPKQGDEGAPDAWVEVAADVAEGLEGIAVGQDIVLLTWLHQARRDVLKVHPRDDATVPLAGVFATRSQARPNPVGLHRVRVLAVAASGLRVGPLEAVDGTPVVDIKPVLSSGSG
jgi:tRNA-Thr(GGU) m(6)t(6)A37 methyltransferase TsaA